MSDERTLLEEKGVAVTAWTDGSGRDHFTLEVRDDGTFGKQDEWYPKSGVRIDKNMMLVLGARLTALGLER